MAGSKRSFVYIADDGTAYLAKLDESTYEQSELGFADNAKPAGRIFPIIGKNPVQMRYINCYRTENGVVIRRKFFIGKTDTDIYLNGGQLQLGGTQGAAAVEGGAAWSVSSSVGEKRKFIGFEDTGRTDGDVDAPAGTGDAGAGTAPVAA